MLVEKRYLGRHFHRYGKLLAIRYIGNAGRLAYYRYKPKGADEGFFDHDGFTGLRVVPAAVGADVMGPDCLAAAGAVSVLAGLQVLMTPPLALTRLGSASLWDSHGRCSFFEFGMS